MSLRGARKSALLPIQGAFITQLEEDTIVNTMVQAVVDEAREGQRLPYIEYGSPTAVPYDTKTSYGDDATVTLNIWAPGPGKVVAQRIMDVAMQAVTKQPLVIPGFKFEGIELEFSEVFPDGPAYHGICRFRIYAKQI